MSNAQLTGYKIPAVASLPQSHDNVTSYPLLFAAVPAQQAFWSGLLIYPHDKPDARSSSTRGPGILWNNRRPHQFHEV